MIVQPITAAAFAPFGELVTCGEGEGASANFGTAARFDYTAALHNGRPHARANMVTVRCKPVSLPLDVKLLERHPHSSQTFIPMMCSRYLVCVAPSGPDGNPIIEGLKAFIVRPGQAINYRAGVWHHPLVVLDAPAQFAMLVWEDGGKEDCEIFQLPEPVTVTD